MGTSAMQGMQDDPMLRLQYYRETGQADEAKHYETYLRETGQFRDGPAQPPHDFHAEYRSGQLAKRMQRENANDQEQADAETVSPLEAAGHSLAATGANIAQGIPGMEAVQAGVRSVVRRQPYGEALGDIRGQTEKIPTPLRIGERIAGAMPLTKFLPGSPVASGAMLGAADQALAADPDESLGARAGRTALGAAGGAVVGKLGEAAVTMGRMLPTATPAANVIARMAARAQSARNLYGAAMREGQGKLGTTAVQNFLSQPDIAEVVGELQQSRPLQGTAADSPEMLDAVYKTLTDRAAQAKRGLEAVTPSRPNIGRFRLADTKAAQGDLVDAVSGGASLPGPMPTYRTAVQDYAQRSADIEGVKRGNDAMRSALSNKLPSAKNLTRTTPEALEEWSRAADDATKTAAGEGVLGATKSAFHSSPLAGLRALFTGPGVMRQIGVPQQSLADLLVRAGLVGGFAGRP